MLLHVLSPHDSNSPITPIATAWDYATPLSQQTWETYQKQWQAYIEKGLEVLRDYTGRTEAAGVTADFLQTTNSPGRGICQAAKSWRADLIVVGSHQRQGIQELLLGSVSNYVMHHAPCSVIIVALGSDPVYDLRPEQETSALESFQSA